MEIFENEPMRLHTTFKVGGPARYFIKAENTDDVIRAHQLAHERDLPYFILGKGSNLLVSDAGFNGFVIQLGKSFSEIEDLGEGFIKAKGATPLARIARWSIQKGFGQMHKLAGIPGSLGGAIYMNAGAYGQEISQACTEVSSLDSQGKLHTRFASECNFGYRKSLFQELAGKGLEETIISATFKMAPITGKSSDDLEREMQECMAKRRSSQPLSMPNAGSTFKRLAIGAKDMPQQVAPGYYIEQAGLKGYRIGMAEVSTVHANFIVNVGGATANDIKALSEFVQKTVFEKFGISLQREIILLGEF